MARIFKSRRRFSRRLKPFRRRLNKSRFRRRVIRAVNSFSDKKVKYFTRYNESVNNSGSLYHPLEDINVGSAENERIGNKIFLRYVKVQWEMFDNASATLSYRFSVVQRRDNAIGLSQAPTTNTAQPWDLSRWVVLYDMPFRLDSTELQNRTFSKVFKIMKSVTYDASFNTITNMPNDVSFFFWSADVVVPSPILNFGVTITYNDL